MNLQKFQIVSFVFGLGMLLSSFQGQAQNDENAKTLEKYKSVSKDKQAYSKSGQLREHRGLYLAIGLGPAFGTITDEATSTGETLKFKGTAGAFDFRIGGRIDENMILTFDLSSRSMSSPTIEYQNKTVMTSDKLSLTESCYGAGFSYYLMPQNIYFGGTLGIGFYTLDNETTNQSVHTDRGFSGSIRAGKQWWLSDKWGLGIGLIGSATNVKNNTNGFIERFTGPRLTLLVQATLH